MGVRVGASLRALPSRGDCSPQAWSPSGTDLHTEGSLANWSGVSFRATPMQHQALYHPDGYPFSVIASPMGAPMAVMLLGQLIALGARRLLYLRFCGALDSSYRIVDLFLPVYAIRDEGTSYHYLPAEVILYAS